MNIQTSCNPWVGSGGSSKYYLITHEEEFYTLHISCPEQFTTTSKVNDDNTNIYTRDHKPIKLFVYSSIL